MILLQKQRLLLGEESVHRGIALNQKRNSVNNAAVLRRSQAMLLPQAGRLLKRQPLFKQIALERWLLCCGARKLVATTNRLTVEAASAF